MNRRGFVTGVGAVAAAGAAAQALRGPSAGSVISGGLHGNNDPIGSRRFNPNTSPVGTARIEQSAPGGGVTLGYIPDSAAFVNASAVRAERLMLRDLWGLANVRAAIGILGYVPSASPTIERADVTVNFSLTEPPFYAPFYAWQYVNVPGQHVKSSSPLRFTASVPDAAGIAVSYRVKSPTSGAIASGTLDYPIGGSGLGLGIYALAGPSPATGGAPDWDGITLGQKAGSLARRDGRVIDFDYITLLLAPARPG